MLGRGYKIPSNEIAEAIRRLTSSANVVVNRPAVEAGLAVLNAGGDFADGVIAFEGRALGADSFVSFDKTAVTIMTPQGEAARLLSSWPVSPSTAARAAAGSAPTNRLRGA